MDKKSYQPMTIGHVPSEGTKWEQNEKKKRTLLSFFGLVRAVEGKSFFRERSSNFSLDFPAFGPSILVGLRIKVVLRCKGYAWTPVLWSFKKSER